MKLGAVGFETLELPPFLLQSGGAIDLGELTLTERPSARIRVIDAETRKPVEGARIALRRSGSGTPFRSRSRSFDAHSDARGRAALDLPTQSIARLDVEAAGYALSREDRSTRDLSKTWTVELAPASRASVRVLGPLDGPVPGALVQIVDPHRFAVTGQNGSVQLGGLGPGVFDVLTTPREEGRAWPIGDKFERGASDEHTAQLVIGKRGSATVMLFESPRAQVNARVLDEGTGVAGAVVILVPRSTAKQIQRRLDLGEQNFLRGALRSDWTGRVHASSLAPGEWTMFVAHVARASCEVFEVTLEGGANDVVLRLSDCRVRGVVTSPRGKPVAGARVGVTFVATHVFMGFTDALGARINPPTFSTADAFGRFEIRGLRPNAKFRLFAEAVGLARVWTTNFPKRDDDAYTHQAQLMFARSTGELRVDIVNGSGDPVLGELQVSLYRTNPAQQQTKRVVDVQVAQNGVTTFAALNEGYYHVGVADAELGFVRVLRDKPATVVLHRP